MSNELKPCPLCGSTNLKQWNMNYFDDSVLEENRSGWTFHWHIKCNNCSCSVEFTGKTRDGVVKAWNRRA